MVTEVSVSRGLEGGGPRLLFVADDVKMKNGVVKKLSVHQCCLFVCPWLTWEQWWLSVPRLKEVTLSLMGSASPSVLFTSRLLFPIRPL